MDFQGTVQATSDANVSTTTAGRIILLHGFGAGGWMMRSMARRLSDHGFTVDNWSYPSLFQSIEVPGRQLVETLRRYDEAPDSDPLYLVAHSMGCIVSRYALVQYKPRKLQRMVMLAPPNRGTRLATFCAPWLGRILPPICQLSQAADSWVNQLPVVDGVEIGIIAATWDALVPLQSTFLGCEADHIVLRSLHAGLVFQEQAAQQVAHFLKQGRFLRS